MPQNRYRSRSKPLRNFSPYATHGLFCLPHQVPNLDPGRVAFDHPACSPSTLGLLRKPAQTHCLFFEGIKKMYRHLHSISFWIYCTQGTRSPWPLHGLLDHTDDHIACSGTPKASWKHGIGSSEDPSAHAGGPLCCPAISHQNMKCSQP